jgi:hypothetical protein
MFAENALSVPCSQTDHLCQIEINFAAFYFIAAVNAIIIVNHVLSLIYFPLIST